MMVSSLGPKFRSKLPQTPPTTGANTGGSAMLNDLAAYEPWRKLWDGIASPPLWSHAKYVFCTTPSA